MHERGAARHIVLVHGAWQGSWAFDAWCPLLQALGWITHAVDLPGNGWPPLGGEPADLDSYTAHVAGVVRRIAAPVVVVGHSGGGITASQVAEAVPELVSCVVYLAGMMLPSEMSYADLLAEARRRDPAADYAGVTPWLDWSPDRARTTVRPEGALHCFVHDCGPDAACEAIARLRAQPETGRDMRNRLTAARHGRVPRIYVECRDDRSVMLPLQRLMQELSPGAARISLGCGHVPQLAEPALLTRLLVPELVLRTA